MEKNNSFDIATLLVVDQTSKEVPESPNPTGDRAAALNAKYGGLITAILNTDTKRAKRQKRSSKKTKTISPVPPVDLLNKRMTSANRSKKPIKLTEEDAESAAEHEAMELESRKAWVAQTADAWMNKPRFTLTPTLHHQQQQISKEHEICESPEADILAICPFKKALEEWFELAADAIAKNQLFSFAAMDALHDLFCCTDRPYRYSKTCC